LLQDDGEDTYQANRSLGLDEDSRDFLDAAVLIKYFHGNKDFRLMTNNPKKIKDLNTYGLDKITPVKHLIGITEYNKEYLSAKRNWGHRLDEDDLQD
jgi:GTP cyclohydrolase II